MFSNKMLAWLAYNLTTIIFIAIYRYEKKRCKLYFDEDGIYEDIETKYYKNIKSAYNYIIKMLED